MLWAFRERILDLKNDRRFRYILIFKNHGAAAGATLEHSHSQLIALPIVPDFVREEIEGARQHFMAKERCVYCDIIKQELAAGRRVILETADIVALAPYAPRFPFETWVLPRRHAAHFDRLSDAELADLAAVMRTVLRRLTAAAGDVAYNYLLHTAPPAAGPGPHYHWHWEILPRLTGIAGYELATGCYLNPLPPEEAAERLRVHN